MSVSISEQISVKLQKMASPQAVDSLVRGIAEGLLGEIKTRIHEEGKNAKGGQIGTYSYQYLLRRQKPPFNRTSDRKVILSLTGQMENDFKVIGLGNSSYGLGFSNSFNADKAEWNEERYGKIYATTPDEKKLIHAEINDWIARTFK